MGLVLGTPGLSINSKLINSGLKECDRRLVFRCLSSVENQWVKDPPKGCGPEVASVWLPWSQPSCRRTWHNSSFRVADYIPLSVEQLSPQTIPNLLHFSERNKAFPIAVKVPAVSTPSVYLNDARLSLSTAITCLVFRETISLPQNLMIKNNAWALKMQIIQ